MAKKIDIYYVSKDDVQVFIDSKKERYEACKVVPETRTLNYIRSSGTDVLYSKNSSFSKLETLSRFSIFKPQFARAINLPISDDDGFPVLEDQSAPVENLRPGQWIAILYEDEWWPGEVTSVQSGGDLLRYEIKHVFKPVAENKFTSMHKAQIEVITGPTYLAILPGDPPPLDHRTRYYGYDSETSKRVSIAKAQALNL